jgi:F-type H+-transporting ATPase subunit b
VLIDWFTIVAQIVNFVILVLLLRRFLYRPIVRAMEEREAAIASRVEEAERREREAEEEAKTWRLKNEELEGLRDELLHEAGQEAEEWRRELMQQARREVAGSRARWEQAIEEEQEAFLQELRQRTMWQVHNIARRALADLANTELEAHLADVFIRRLRADGHEDITRALREAQEPLVIRTAFPSPPELQHKLREAIVDQAANDVELEFETVPDLVCGIELRAGDYRIAWSLDDYLGSLEQDLIQALGEEAGVNGSEPAHNGSG